MARAQWLDGGKRWLCLYFPALAIDYWQRSQVSPQALALYEGQVLVQCCPIARAAGVVAGMSLASARALLPAIALRPHVPAQAQALLTSLAHWAYGFTPLVMPEPPDKLLLEIAGSQRLFRGLPALLARMERELQSWGCDTYWGLAPTAPAARLLALAHGEAGEPSLAQQCQALEQGRWGDWLAEQPLSRLSLSAASAQRLSRAGFTRLAQLLAVSPASLGRRFDKALVQWLQALQGLVPVLAQPLNLAPEFDRNQVFMYGLTDCVHLHAPVTQLLAELKQFLRQRQLVSKSLAWRFVHLDKTRSELRVSVQRAHADTDEFLRLTQLKLEQFRLPAPVEVVGLRALDLAAAEPVPAGLFPELRDQCDEVGRLIDRLYQRLPVNQFFSLRLQDEHLPELQQCQTRARARKPSPGQRAPASNLLSPWLYAEPQLLQQRRDQLLWRGEPVHLVSLAERIDSHWWQQRQRRDYFVARVGCRYLRIFFCHRQRHWYAAGSYVC